MGRSSNAPPGQVEPPPASVSAVILCGGRSRRFAAGGEAAGADRVADRDKALALLGGRRFIDRVVDAARAMTDDIVLATGVEPRYADLGLPIVLDEPAAGGAGPLVGLLAGLKAVRRDTLFVLAVDHPLVTAEALRFLRDALGGYEAVIPEADGVLHPLCALVRRAPAEAAAVRLLAAGRRAPRELAQELKTRRLAATEGPLARAVYNVNSPEDLERAEALFSVE